MLQDKKRIRARFAILLDHFGCSIEQLGSLTDRQINDLYFHPRDEQTGAIRLPAPRTRTPEEGLRAELAALDGLLASHLIGPENHAECARKLREKYGG